MSVNKGIVLENGLDLREVITTGSILHLNEDFNDDNLETEKDATRALGVMGEPVHSIEILEKDMTVVDEDGFVKKKVLEEGGGKELADDSTVSIAYSGYWEKELDPFDVRPLYKPLVVDFHENGLLPGMLTAIKSMLVGELSIFVIDYPVMYGELGIPPRMKAKTKCVFYIKLIKSIISSKQGINFSESNIFQRVSKDAKMLLVSGVQLSKSKNHPAAIQLFNKAVHALHKVRLADENEEKLQQKLLVKLYTNLAICCNKSKLPLRACIACNEVNRLTNLWNMGKLLFQNAKALRMIGAFERAEKRLNRAMELYPDSEEMKAEYDLLQKTKKSCDQSRLMAENLTSEELSKHFKDEVDSLIKNFKEDENLCKLTLPTKLSSAEVDYIREVCERENIFCNKIQRNFALDKAEEKPPDYAIADDFDDMLF